MAETQEVMELSLEKVIESKLVQNNVTDQVLKALKEKYGGMKLEGLENKESYLELKAAAKDCAKVRTLTVKICKEGREEAVRTQKLWIAKEKEIVSQVDVVESALDSEIKKYDDEVKRKEQEEIKRQEEAYINRQAVLNKMGATYQNGSFVLGEASFEGDLIKGMSQDIWDETVIPKFQAEYEKIEAIRIQQEKEKAEREEAIRAEQEKLRQEQEAFRLQQEKFKEEQEEAARKVQEEKNKLRERRNNELRPYISFIRDYNTMIGMEEESYQKELSDVKLGAEQQWEYERKEQIRKQEEEKQQAINDAIQKEKDRQAEEARQSELKKQQEEDKRKAEMEAAGDRVKWESFITAVGKIETYDMRSGQYRRKMQVAKEKLEEILSL